MKKIAIPSDGGKISQHFGHCSKFSIITTEGEKIVNKEVVDNPGHKPGFLPKFLKEKGVDCVLAGGMGRRAIDLFKKDGIETITGAKGSVDQAVKSFLDGTLDPDGNICDH